MVSPLWQITDGRLQTKARKKALELRGPRMWLDLCFATFKVLRLFFPSLSLLLLFLGAGYNNGRLAVQKQAINGCVRFSLEMEQPRAQQGGIIAVPVRAPQIYSKYSIFSFDNGTVLFVLESNTSFLLCSKQCENERFIFTSTTLSFLPLKCSRGEGISHEGFIPGSHAVFKSAYGHNQGTKGKRAQIKN